MIQWIERVLFSIFPLFYLSFIVYYIIHPLYIHTDIEYYSLMNSVFFYIIFMTMDILLSPFLYYSNILLFLTFHSILFELLSFIQYQYFQNIFNVFLSSYCIFGFFKFTYLYLKERNNEEENSIYLSI